jgi:hypothetical protein
MSEYIKNATKFQRNKLMMCLNLLETQEDTLAKMSRQKRDGKDQGRK